MREAEKRGLRGRDGAKLGGRSQAEGAGKSRVMGFVGIMVP